MRYFGLLLVMLIFSNVCASEYMVEFNQIDRDLVVREYINQNYTSYVLKSDLDKSNEGYYFVKKIESVSDFNSFVIKLNLDTGVSAIPGEIFPTGYAVESDGQIISIVWNYSNVQKGQVFAFFASLDDAKDTINYWFYSILAVFTILFVFVGVYYFKRRKNVDKYLLDEERKVVSELKLADRHEMWQKNIQSKLQLSKAKTSRLVRNLESRGLIEKIPFGNTNKIRLK